MKTMVDFIIDVSHLGDLRQAFLEAVKIAQSSKDIQKFFDDLGDTNNQSTKDYDKYDVTDDECMRIYENNKKIINNPYIGKTDVKGY